MSDSCRKCGSEFSPAPSEIKNYIHACRACRNAERQRRAKPPSASAEYQAKYKEANREKVRARGMVYDHIRRGKMKRGFCEVCGANKANAHHDDYSRPLSIRWLCHIHHGTEHRG